MAANRSNLDVGASSNRSSGVESTKEPTRSDASIENAYPTKSLAILLPLLVGMVIFLERMQKRFRPILPVDSSAFTVDLNEASLAELKLLPGVGDKLAEDILRYRATQGRFDSVDDLINVAGIKNGRMEQLRKFVTVEREKK